MGQARGAKCSASLAMCGTSPPGLTAVCMTSRHVNGLCRHVELSAVVLEGTVGQQKNLRRYYLVGMHPVHMPWHFLRSLPRSVFVASLYFTGLLRGRRCCTLTFRRGALSNSF